MERRGIIRAKVDANAINFPGAAQVVAVKRECHEFDPRLSDVNIENKSKSSNENSKKTKKNKTKAKNKTSTEFLYYISSIPLDNATDEEMLEIIRGHWAAIENGTHLLRDVGYGEDACRISKKIGAWTMTTLRNMAIAMRALAVKKGLCGDIGLKSWCRQMTFSFAQKLFSM